MPVDLLPGESKQVDVAMIPLAPGALDWLYFYMVDNPIRDTVDTADYVVYCPVKNTGSSPRTQSLTLHRKLWTLEGVPYEWEDTQQFTVQPGQTYLFRYYGHWLRYAPGEMWFVSDWGEQTQRMACTFGYAYNGPADAEVIATRRGSDHVTLRYSDNHTNSDRWVFYLATPAYGPTKDQSYYRTVRVPSGEPVASSFRCIHFSHRGLWSKREYLADASGVFHTWTTFWTL